MPQFTELIKKINQDKRLVPDLLKAENGNNFRAISESAILDVIDPILHEMGWFYTVKVKKSDLQVREAFGSKGRKLQFIATIEIALDFFYDDPDYNYYHDDRCHTEAVGMGIDDNDKAMGKAYTYAVKYALLKIFRLRYGDDPDFEASKALYLEKPKEEKNSTEEKPESKKTTPKKKKEEKNSSEIPMSEAQRDYILGLMKKCKVEEKQILEKFGVEPSIDKFVPMKTARAIIKWFEDEDYLPF